MKVFCGNSHIDIFFLFREKKWRSLFLWLSLRYNVSVMLSFFYDKKYACLFESKQRVKNLILVERKVPSSFRYESPFIISKCRSSYHIEKKIGHIKMTVRGHFNLKKYSHKEDGLRKKLQAVIVFLKLDRYLSQIVYRNFVRNFWYISGL